MLRFLTAGESHGPCLTAIIEGLPAGLPVRVEDVDRALRRRQGGYGRGGRQQIEQDQVRFTGGLARGLTTGAPLALVVVNRDGKEIETEFPDASNLARTASNLAQTASNLAQTRFLAPWTKPRPGHADWAGGVKYGLDDLRLVAERASARETAARVAVGAVAAALLNAAGVQVGSYVEAIGGEHADVEALPLEQRLALALTSDVACPDAEATARMRARIDQAGAAGDSLGGCIVLVALGAPVGLGSYVHWDRRLDARIAAAIMSIPAIKGVEIGPAFANADLPGTQVHDAFFPGAARLERHSNRAGGLEGGMSNGQPILVRAAMKPIPTTVTPQATVDLSTGQAAATEYSRSDVCAVPAAAVVGEAMLAWVLADALLERCGGDDWAAILRRVNDDRG